MLASRSVPGLCGGSHITPGREVAVFIAEEQFRQACVASSEFAVGRRPPGAADLARASWRKSSWSAYNGNCVEVADLGGRQIGVRDTKDAGLGPVLVFADAAWRSFLADVKKGGR